MFRFCTHADAGGGYRAAAWRARSHALLAAVPASWFLLVRDIETSASVLPPDTLPVAGHVNHRGRWQEA